MSREMQCYDHLDDVPNTIRQVLDSSTPALTVAQRIANIKERIQDDRYFNLQNSYV